MARELTRFAGVAGVAKVLSIYWALRFFALGADGVVDGSSLPKDLVNMAIHIGMLEALGVNK